MSEAKSVDELKKEAAALLLEAEKALYKWACAEDIGPERIHAFEVYERVRRAPCRG